MEFETEPAWTKIPAGQRPLARAAWLFRNAQIRHANLLDQDPPDDNAIMHAELETIAREAAFNDAVIESPRAAE